MTSVVPQVRASLRVVRGRRAVAALHDPVIKQKSADIGIETVANAPERVQAFQKSEFARWKKVIEAGKITAD